METFLIQGRFKPGFFLLCLYFQTDQRQIYLFRRRSTNDSTKHVKSTQMSSREPPSLASDHVLGKTHNFNIQSNLWFLSIQWHSLLFTTYQTCVIICTAYTTTHHNFSALRNHYKGTTTLARSDFQIINYSKI